MIRIDRHPHLIDVDDERRSRREGEALLERFDDRRAPARSNGASQRKLTRRPDSRKPCPQPNPPMSKGEPHATAPRAMVRFGSAKTRGPYQLRRIAAAKPATETVSTAAPSLSARCHVAPSIPTAPNFRAN